MPIPIYKAPVLNLEGKRMVEIPFSGLVATGAQLTLVSKQITYPFRVIQAKMLFDRNAQNLIWHYWLHSGEPAVSTIGIPSGTNIFSREMTAGYFIGEAVVRTINTSIDIEEERQFIKLHTVNGIGVGYYINASIVIQEI